MPWTDIATDWSRLLPRLQRAFPRVDKDLITQPPQDAELLARRLAEQNDLTFGEANEQLSALMQVERLARTTADIRAD